MTALLFIGIGYLIFKLISSFDSNTGRVNNSELLLYDHQNGKSIEECEILRKCGRYNWKISVIFTKFMKFHYIKMRW